MGFLVKAARAMEGVFRPRAQAGDGGYPITTPQQLEQFLLGVLGGQSSAGVAVTVDRARQVSAVYACVRVIAETTASLPLAVYRRMGDGRKEPAKDHPLFMLLSRRPNEWMSSFEWREVMAHHLNLRGNAYSLVVTGVGGAVSELLPLPPDRVVPKQDDRTLAVTYEYTRPDGRRVILPRKSVLHVKGPGDSGLAGLNPIQAHRETLGGAIAAQEHGNRVFRNGGKPAGILKLAGAMAPDDRKALRDDFDLTHGGENAFRTAVLPVGVDYEKLEASLSDLQYLESMKLRRSEIAAIFRVPPHMIGDLERATFSNIEHQGLEFATHTIMPWCVRIEQAIERDLLDNDPDLFVKHNMDAILRGDAKSRAEALQIQRRNGVINANEWREKEDLNPRDDPGGEEYIVERNMGAQDGAAPNKGDPA